MVDNVRIVNGDASRPADVYKTATTNSLSTTDYLNRLVAEGSLFSVTGIEEAIVDNASAEMLVIVPEGVNLHIAIAGTASGDAYAYLFENTTVSANGTQVTAVNRSRPSLLQPDTTFFSGPTLISQGDQLLASFAPGGSKKTAVGSSGASFGAWLLKEGTYLLRFTNKSTVAAVMSMILDFYEE